MRADRRHAEFRFRYRHVDVLVIDDIHFLARRDRTQEEFFHTFNTLFQASKQIILSSDAPPNEIPTSKTAWSRVSIPAWSPASTNPALKPASPSSAKKASLRGITLPEEVVAYIARRVESNTRELEGAITKIQGHAMLNGGKYDLDVARAALGDIVPPSERMVSIQQIIDAVIRVYNVRVWRPPIQEPPQIHRPPPASLHVRGPQQNPLLAGGNRRLLRRPRPHHRHARHPYRHRRPRI